MSDEEYRLRLALEPVSLVVETNFSGDEISQIQYRYGQAANALQRRGYSYRDIIRKYPALTLAALVGHAALAYDQGAYWDEFFAEIGRPRDLAFENSLRQALADLLDKFKLARFPELEGQRQYVMTFAMHAGIPVHCLGDLLRVVDAHLTQGRDATGAALIEWLEEPGKEHRTLSLDVPVRNFIHYGGTFAVDILDRIIEVVDATLTDPALLDSGLDSSTTGLPDVIVEVLVQQLRDNPLGWQGRRANRTGVQRRPVLHYSVDDDQLLVAIPYPRVSPDSPWRVSFDGRVRQVYVERGWGVASDDHPPTLVPVPEPVREILLWHSPSDLSFTLSTVDKADPMLVFNADGACVPKRELLKRGVAWVVYPSSCDLVDLGSGEPVATAVTGTPAGWRGWSSGLVDLETVESIQLRRAGSFVGRARSVRRDTAPTFQLGEPVPGCLTPDGRKVYTTRPWVMLPADVSPRPTSWQVRTRRLDSPNWITDDFWESAEVTTCVDPFDESLAPQLGLFEIAVAGPLGADVRAVVFLAEGLAVDFNNPPRFPVVGGLSPSAAMITSEHGLTASESWLEFDRGDRNRRITVSDGADPVELVIQPPSVEIRTGLIGKPAPWRSSAEAYTPDELGEPRFVAIRAPGVASVQFLFLNSVGESIQTETQPRCKAGDVYEVSTRRFVDAARNGGSGRIIARIINDEGKQVDVTVVAVRPPTFCSGAHLVAGDLIFHDLHAGEDLAVNVWCSTAPWLEPWAIPLPNDRAGLPAELVGVGPLVCEVFIDDPWVAVEPPRWPGPSAIRVGQPGWVAAGSSAKLSRFLAGAGPAPETVSSMPEVWSALCFPPADDVSSQRIHSALTGILRSEPRTALEALGNSTIPLEDKMALLIRTELVNCSFAADFTLNELHADPWFGCMVELSDLAALHRDRGQKRVERAQTLAYLKDKGGDQLIESLRVGKFDYVREGSFARNTVAMHAMPIDQVEAILDELRLVPGALLDSDTRVAASVDAFRRRAEWTASGWSKGFAAQLAHVMSPIRRVCPLAYDVIGLRNAMLDGLDVEHLPWIQLTLQSLVLAVVARLEAHDRIAGQYMNSGMLATWTRLAELAPRLVAADLLIAEDLVVHYCHGDLIGDES
ncbi:hypothetical protein [Mycolicibacter minnesotensis]